MAVNDIEDRRIDIGNVDTDGLVRLVEICSRSLEFSTLSLRRIADRTNNPAPRIKDNLDRPILLERIPQLIRDRRSCGKPKDLLFFVKANFGGSLASRSADVGNSEDSGFSSWSHRVTSWYAFLRSNIPLFQSGAVVEPYPLDWRKFSFSISRGEENFLGDGKNANSKLT